MKALSRKWTNAQFLFVYNCTMFFYCVCARSNTSLHADVITAAFLFIDGSASEKLGVPDLDCAYCDFCTYLYPLEPFQMLFLRPELLYSPSAGPDCRLLMDLNNGELSENLKNVPLMPVWKSRSPATKCTIYNFCLISKILLCCPVASKNMTTC